MTPIDFVLITLCVFTHAAALAGGFRNLYLGVRMAVGL